MVSITECSNAIGFYSPEWLPELPLLITILQIFKEEEPEDEEDDDDEEDENDKIKDTEKKGLREMYCYSPSPFSHLGFN